MDVCLTIELFRTQRCNIYLWFKMLFYLIKHNASGSLSCFLLSIHAGHLRQIHTRSIYFHESLFLLFFLWPKKFCPKMGVINMDSSWRMKDTIRTVQTFSKYSS